MNNNNRSTRFLLDIVDKKLGSVEREIKFDKWMIFIGVLIMTISGVLVWLCAGSHPALSVIFLVMVLFGISVIYIMIRELLDDKKKQKSQKDTY